MSFTTKGQKKAVATFDPTSGLNAEDVAAIAQTKELAEAEARIAAEAVTESKRQYILQEIKVDQFTTLRRRVELTPSMCRAKGCGFDASKEVGYPAGWKTVPHDQLLPNGKSLGEAIISVLQRHRDTTHGIEESHIMNEDEVNRQKQWAGVPGQFLTNQAHT
jgi:hypothetical protein